MEIVKIICSFIPLNLLGVLCFWIGFKRWRARLSCKEKIQGIFLCCDVLGFGNNLYTFAKFEYTYHGRKIKQYARERFSAKKGKTFQTGNSYPLYVNPKNPQIIRCTKKTFHFEDFFLVLLGSFFIVGSLFVLFEQIIKFWNKK